MIYTWSMLFHQGYPVVAIGYRRLSSNFRPLHACWVLYLLFASHMSANFSIIYQSFYRLISIVGMSIFICMLYSDINCHADVIQHGVAFSSHLSYSWFNELSASPTSTIEISILACNSRSIVEFSFQCDTNISTRVALWHVYIDVISKPYASSRAWIYLCNNFLLIPTPGDAISNTGVKIRLHWSLVRQVTGREYSRVFRIVDRRHVQASWRLLFPSWEIYLPNPMPCSEEHHTVSHLNHLGLNVP